VELMGTSSSPTEDATWREVKVRRIRSGEWAARRDLRLRALACDPLAFGSTLARERDFSDVRWQELTDRGASSEESATFVAQSETAGWVGTVTIARVQGEYHLFAMWVDPRFRRRGIGGALLDAALEWFRIGAPHAALRLDVNPRQKDAVRLYEKRGFRPTGGTAPLGHTEGEVVIGMVLDARRPGSRPRRATA